MRRAPLVLAVALLALLAVPARAVDLETCTDTTGNAHPYRVDQRFVGQVAYPDTAPEAIVVFFHGYGHDAGDWAEHHLDRVATDLDVVTVAMDYPGQSETATWQVREGAEASVAAARDLADRCGTAVPIVAYGVSMGANASGIALASAPGLFDWWVAVEGAHNVIETYLEARALAPVNAYAASATRGIEHEMGGPIETHADTYRSHSNVLLAHQIKASQIEGAVFVHGVGDGLVPYDQSREMAAALTDLEIGVDFTTVLTRGSDMRAETDGTTPDGYAYDAIFKVEDPENEEADPEISRFAGHANENSEIHLVSRLGFERLRDLLAGGIDFIVREHVVDGAVNDGQRVP